MLQANIYIYLLLGIAKVHSSVPGPTLALGCGEKAILCPFIIFHKGRLDDDKIHALQKVSSPQFCWHAQTHPGYKYTSLLIAIIIDLSL